MLEQEVAASADGICKKKTLLLLDFDILLPYLTADTALSESTPAEMMIRALFKLFADWFAHLENVQIAPFFIRSSDLTHRETARVSTLFSEEGQLLSSLHYLQPDFWRGKQESISAYYEKVHKSLDSSSKKPSATMESTEIAAQAMQSFFAEQEPDVTWTFIIVADHEASSSDNVRKINARAWKVPAEVEQASNFLKVAAQVFIDIVLAIPDITFFDFFGYCLSLILNPTDDEAFLNKACQAKQFLSLAIKHQGALTSSSAKLFPQNPLRSLLAALVQEIQKDDFSKVSKEFRNSYHIHMRMLNAIVYALIGNAQTDREGSSFITSLPNQFFQVMHRSLSAGKRIESASLAAEQINDHRAAFLMLMWVYEGLRQCTGEEPYWEEFLNILLQAIVHTDETHVALLRRVQRNIAQLDLLLARQIGRRDTEMRSLSTKYEGRIAFAVKEAQCPITYIEQKFEGRLLPNLIFYADEILPARPFSLENIRQYLEQHLCVVSGGINESSQRLRVVLQPGDSTNQLLLKAIIVLTDLPCTSYAQDITVTSAQGKATFYYFNDCCLQEDGRKIIFNQLNALAIIEEPVQRDMPCLIHWQAPRVFLDKFYLAQNPVRQALGKVFFQELMPDRANDDRESFSMSRQLTSLLQERSIKDSDHWKIEWIMFAVMLPLLSEEKALYERLAAHESSVTASAPIQNSAGLFSLLRNFFRHFFSRETGRPGERLPILQSQHTGNQLSSNQLLRIVQQFIGYFKNMQGDLKASLDVTKYAVSGHVIALVFLMNSIGALIAIAVLYAFPPDALNKFDSSVTGHDDSALHILRLTRAVQMVNRYWEYVSLLAVFSFIIVERYRRLRHTKQLNNLPDDLLATLNIAAEKKSYSGQLALGLQNILDNPLYAGAADIKKLLQPVVYKFTTIAGWSEQVNGLPEWVRLILQGNARSFTHAVGVETQRLLSENQAKNLAREGRARLQNKLAFYAAAITIGTVGLSVAFSEWFKKIERDIEQAKIVGNFLGNLIVGSATMAGDSIAHILIMLTASLCYLIAYWLARRDATLAAATKPFFYSPASSLFCCKNRRLKYQQAFQVVDDDEEAFGSLNAGSFEAKPAGGYFP